MSDLDNVDMEMPVPCKHCGSWFELNDGYGSIKWYDGIVICEVCHEEEVKEVEFDEELEEIKQEISEAEWSIKNAERRLEVLSAQKTLSIKERVVIVKYVD